MSTIFAVSSGRPPAAIAVLRISGPQAFDTVRALAGSVPPPREARVRTVRDADGGVLDRALVIAFPGPDTATGEDLVELHCHGGRAVVDAVERALDRVEGVRRAVAGEFTRRALINGRIDLAEAEGLSDLLGAETERQRLAAMGAVEGRISDQVRDWLDRIASLSARIESWIDFAEESDVGESDVEAVRHAMDALGEEMDVVLAAPPVERLRDGISVVLCGPPNSGKSTLINLLSERDVAIVSPIAGTTRDRIEAPVMRNGIPYVLTDTAGLTETRDAIERIGVSRAEAAMAVADILVWMDDAAPTRPAIWLKPRADELGRDTIENGRLSVSRSDAASIERVWQAIGNAADALLPREDALVFSRQQRDACAIARARLHEDRGDILLLAEGLRGATIALGTILGIDATEAMLDRLFSTFCIGK